MIPSEIAPGVWAATGDMTTVRSRHPQDVAEARQMLAWRANEFLAGRGLLRALLAHVEPRAAEAEVVRGRNGKPGLSRWPRLGISVSHDGNAVAACVSAQRPVGVDIQLSSDCADAIWIWTAQEACVKAEGSGIQGMPRTIDVRPRTTTGTWKEYRWLMLRDQSTIPLSCAWRQR
jgi:4'-phosphopantetheinyl transferase